ncbi:6932_t:CDS:2 [Scutellospora calospora]|uniref:6932_t:CDS:1 n=1 Tax=Scutellospora calospora TaxID=85575 RepID=A0ACA9JU01_9GLOM|nr:6932_t:CDS:2 [Scutellospora calospora]
MIISESQSHPLLQSIAVSDFLKQRLQHPVDSNSDVKFHGISQDTQTGSYLMVMNYVESGDLG